MKRKCENASTGLQVTEWEYGVSQATGSQLASNRLVNRKIFPDTSGSSSSSSGPDSSRVVRYIYNTQSQVTGELDQNETEHAYDYDRLGRLLTDTATVNDAAVDDAIGVLEAVWEVRGLRSRARSRAASNNSILNEVQWDYNDFGQTVREWQEHDGTVDGSTPHVDYAYADPADSATPNTIRRESITYPNTAAITTEYASGLSDALSRPSALKHGTTVLATYKFLGLGTNVEVKYQAAGNLMLTYENGGTGDAGDKYTGLDRFGRLVETIWKIGSDKKVHSTYGRNRFGGVVWRKDDKAHAVSKTTQDNFYWYDGLYQVQQHQRGDLNAYQTGITSPPVQNEVWNYDEMGNWLAYDTEVPSLSQTRDYNKANEITAITNPSSVVQPNYDNAGNMTTMPKAGSWTTECTLKWDAWHRLVELTQGSDDPIRYTYDALTRRIITDGSEYRQYYYDDQWRAVEEHAGATPAVDFDYVWGVLGRWDMVRRRSGTSLATSHFVLKDYLDPVAIADADGDVLERYGYDAFGPVRFMDNNFDPTTSGESEYAWNFLFHAEFLDAETGLYNYGYRYYHPQLGRWLSRDPIGERGGRALYHGFMNSAIHHADKLGLESLAEAVTVLIMDNISIPEIGATGNECCTCSITLCEIIAQFLNKVSASCNDFRDFMLITEHADNFRRAASELSQRWRNRYSQCGLECDSKANWEHRCCCCFGFQEDVSANGLDCLRHFAAVLSWGWPGYLADQWQNVSQLNGANANFNSRAADEHRAEIMSDHWALNAEMEMKRNISKLTPWYQPMASCNSAWSVTYKGKIGDLFRSRFCRKCP